MRLSKSKINTFQQCPRKFRYIYVDELPRAEPDDESPLTIGTEIHNIFEEFLKDVDLEWFSSIGSAGQLNIIKEYDIDNKYISHLRNFLVFLNDIIDDGYNILGCEPHFESSELNLHGYLDLVLEKDGKLTVIDYKTGKAKAITEFRLELIYYALLAQKELNLPVEMVGIFFSKTGHLKLANFIEEPDKGAWISYEDVQSAVLYLKEVERKIEEEDFRFKTNWLCDYCDYQTECREEGYQEYGVFE